MNFKFLIFVFAALFACASSAKIRRCVPGYCTLPAVTGFCKALYSRWYFDVDTKTCQPFVWGGCGGNSNNFETEAECLSTCG